MRRPGYLAGFTPFGRARTFSGTKGTITQMPSAPPPETMSPGPTSPAGAPPQAPQAAPAPMQQAPQAPMPRPAAQRPPADPATLARIAQLQAKLGRKPGTPVPGAPGRPAATMRPAALRPPVIADDDDDEDD